jgi:hypothetical protein
LGVGVISDAHDSEVDDMPNPEVFVPITPGGPDGAELVVRSALPPATLATSVMSTLRALNPD